jgi:transcriptional/translational regulatory protein YebC/TACO1
MAGHSHSANIKHRKDRQDSARSQLFLKVRRKIENIIREEHEVNEKSLSIARENKFPKEKVYQIWEKIKSGTEKSHSERTFYQAPFGIFIYLEGDNTNIESESRELKLKKMPLSSLPSYFQLFYSLKLELEEEENYNLEEYLLTYFPVEILEKMNYSEKSVEVISNDKRILEKTKDITKQNELKLKTKEEKTFWKALVYQKLFEKEAINCWTELEKKLAGSKFYANVEK